MQFKNGKLKSYRSGSCCCGGKRWEGIKEIFWPVWVCWVAKWWSRELAIWHKGFNDTWDGLTASKTGSDIIWLTSSHEGWNVKCLPSLSGCRGTARVTQHAPAVGLSCLREIWCSSWQNYCHRQFFQIPFFPPMVSKSMIRLEVISGDQLHQKSSLHCLIFEQS